MSHRTLIEMNHDYMHRLDAEFGEVLYAYLRLPSDELAAELEGYGVKIIAVRHHTDEFDIPKGTSGFKDETQ